jgi:hypothetical protein
MELFKNACLSLNSCFKMLMADHFKFYRAEKCLGIGIVVGHSRAVLTAYYVILLKWSLIILTDTLNATVEPYAFPADS